MKSLVVMSCQFLNLISFVFSIDKTEQAYFLFRETSSSSYRSIEFNYDAAVIERNNFGCVMKIIVSCVFVRLGFSIVHCFLPQIHMILS